MAKQKQKLQPPSGMHDIMPDQWQRWNHIIGTAGSIAEMYGFSRIETPLFEHAELFTKGLGAATDIVEKEMYVLKTKGGDVLAARPEGTASIARAYLSQNMVSLPQPVKLWYAGPMFRHEKPQHGRLRQFWQWGLEVLGDEDPIIDAEIIQLFYVSLRELGLSDITVHLNSIGCSQCRPYYKKMLLNYYRTRTDQICGDCRRRLKQNPIRVLDCKDERCGRVRQGAPQFIDHLCEACHNHFKSLLEFFEELEIPYLLDFYLVRGLDYYSRTVFEIFSEGGEERAPEEEQQQKEAQPLRAPLALASGGRYDDLIKRLGGRQVPGVGGAMGLERVAEYLNTKGVNLPKIKPPRIFFAQLGILAKKRSLKLFEQLRRSGINVASSFGRDSIKSQLKVADRLGVEVSLIFGQQEALEHSIIVREMTTGIQETVRLDALIPKLKERLKRK